MAIRSALLMSLMLAACLAMATADTQHQLDKINRQLEAHHDALAEAEAQGIGSMISKYLPMDKLMPFIVSVGDPEQMCSALKAGAEQILATKKGWFAGMAKKMILGNWDTACPMVIQLACSKEEAIEKLAGSHAATVDMVFKTVCGSSLIQMQQQRSDLERWAAVRNFQDPAEPAHPKLSEIDEMLDDNHEALVQAEAQGIGSMVMKYLPMDKLMPFVMAVGDPSEMCGALKGAAESILATKKGWFVGMAKKMILGNWDTACPMVIQMLCSKSDDIEKLAGSHAAVVSGVMGTVCGDEELMMVEEGTSDLQRWALVSQVNQLSAHESEDAWTEH